MNRFIIDVREAEEYATGHVKNSLNIPSSKIKRSDVLNSIPKDAEIILYCLSGGRANASKDILEFMGYTNVINGISKDLVSAKYGS